ncbi:hypothetical protein DYBT9623_01352 [Dyadobacter sp. CECT 9623]|uniref:Secretion system C-terminal sorting domain-containing protein n=1 Tax=Dyadobacter linearis TaxID=2823330 RepID=A0ABM8UME4_9BACT|nr:T9SS type A sorting domain-containing protein [Dyadobacter sp. CECT 9623]CAG5068620.1 hypothetical protein DYBT9623_01352 [Dyadobacter sp. CECT 9623]
MKTEMRQLLRAGLCLTGSLFLTSAYAQDVAINITPQTIPMLNHTNGLLRVSMCNTNPTNITAPPNKLRPQISFPDNLEILDAVNTDGTPLTDYTVQSLTNVEGDHTIRLLYNGTLAQFDCIEFDVVVSGKEIGTGLITCTLGFQGPQTVGNNAANDNSTATMPVELNLPVKLKSFSVSKEGNTANLNWVTTEEVNSDRFDVQKSDDGKKWNTIESVQALGESKVSKTYTAIDAAPFNGQNLYRLHMIDKDGTSAYSEMRNLNFNVASHYVYPNPVSDVLILKGTSSKIANVTVSDVNGKAIYQSNANVREIDVRQFKAGMYVVRVRTEDGQETSLKVLVVR